MKVYGRCKHCLAENSYKTSAHTRVEFAMKHGERIDLKCENCNRKNQFEVDELFANPSKIAQITAGFIFLISTPLLTYVVMSIFKISTGILTVYIFGSMLLIPVKAYTTINKKDEARVRDFNRAKLKSSQYHKKQKSKL